MDRIDLYLLVNRVYIKLKNEAKHVVPKAEDWRTRVQFPPPPPNKGYKMKDVNYLKTNNKTEKYEPFILGEKEVGQVHWLTDKDSSGKTTYSGLWKCSSMTFEYEFPGDEIIYCIEGSLIIKIENNEEIIINEGDIVSFKKGIKSTWTIKESFKKFFVIHNIE